MARSIKKNNYLTSSGSSSRKYFKKLTHKRLRRKVKIQLSQDDWETMPHRYEMVDPWDIDDWIWYQDDNETRNAYYCMVNHKQEPNCRLVYDCDAWFHRPVMWYKGKYRLRK